MARRSPIWLAKRRPFGPKGPTYHLWECDEDRLKMARFVSRRHPEQTVIVHRSTKGNRWQTTYFEDGIPTGDIQSETCRVALAGLGRKSYRLREVIT